MRTLLDKLEFEILNPVIVKIVGDLSRTIYDIGELINRQKVVILGR
jgi:hypothetical protein